MSRGELPSGTAVRSAFRSRIREEACIPLEDDLQAILDRVVDWLKYEEAKNVALVTLNGVGAGFIVTWLSTPQRLEYVLKGCLTFLLLSILVGLVSFYPAIRIPEAVRTRIARRRRSRFEPSGPEPNVLFFAEIAGAEVTTYLANVCAATGDNPTDVRRQIAHNYASEIIANAELAVVKVWFFKVAFLLTFIAFVATVLTVFGDQILAHIGLTLPFIKNT